MANFMVNGKFYHIDEKYLQADYFKMLFDWEIQKGKDPRIHVTTLTLPDNLTLTDFDLYLSAKNTLTGLPPDDLVSALAMAGFLMDEKLTQKLVKELMYKGYTIDLLEEYKPLILSLVKENPQLLFKNTEENLKQIIEELYGVRFTIQWALETFPELSYEFLIYFPKKTLDFVKSYDSVFKNFLNIPNNPHYDSSNEIETHFERALKDTIYFDESFPLFTDLPRPYQILVIDALVKKMAEYPLAPEVEQYIEQSFKTEESKKLADFLISQRPYDDYTEYASDPFRISYTGDPLTLWDAIARV